MTFKIGRTLHPLPLCPAACSRVYVRSAGFDRCMACYQKGGTGTDHRVKVPDF